MSILKTAWANLQDGLGNRFSWSHVKAIFYNYAEKKLLSTKLDEMDNLIEQKIAKAMMSNVQTNDQTKVPTSALVYSMNQDIDKNANDITQLYSNIKWGTKIIYSVTVGANQEVSASFPASDFGLTTKPRAGFISVSNANCLIPIGYDYDDSTNEEIKFRLRSVTEINNMNIRASVLLLV